MAKQPITSSPQIITISHKTTGEVIAKGPKGWGFFPFEGNYYIRDKYVVTDGFQFSGFPGICVYKFLYFWYHLKLSNGEKEKLIAWKYWLPNPLFPFIAFRIGIPANHPSLAYAVEPS